MFCYIELGGDEMRRETLTVLIGGIFSLAIAMGIGRFSYTVILPYMEETFQFTSQTAGFLATSNYLGYFIGALLAGRLNLTNQRVLYLRLTLLISIITTALVGFSESFFIWYALRLISGIASAFIFVVASSIVLDYLSAEGKSQLSGIFYSGVGFGIALSGIIVSPLHKYFDWSGTWIGLAGISLILFIFIISWMKSDKEGKHSSNKGGSTQASMTVPPASWMKWLIIAYGLEGLGYIVTGTFIVSMAEKSVSFHGDATTVWLVVGIAAIPSCIIWSKLASKMGFVQTLIIAMIVQAISILLPAVSENALSLYTSAFLFGATFMGITTLATTLARQMLPVNSHKILGYLTASYALGQMIGPAIAGIITTYTSNYHYASIGASSVIFVGVCLLISGLKYEKKTKGDVSNAIREY